MGEKRTREKRTREKRIREKSERDGGEKEESGLMVLLSTQLESLQKQLDQKSSELVKSGEEAKSCRAAAEVAKSDEFLLKLKR